MNAKQIIKHLNLRPLPIEGGFYRETFHPEEWFPEGALPRRYTGAKRYYSAIYFLITPDSWSTLHRLPTDEIYHFYLGDPVEQLVLYPDGSGEKVLLGNQLEQGALPQVRVPGSAWQGSRLRDGGSFALLGTTMSPGFSAEDFMPADAAALKNKYPDWAYEIDRYVRKHDTL